MTDGKAELAGDGDRGPKNAEALVGQVISERYRIDALLATGGMGAVYRGRHLLLKKRVAIKVLHPEMEDLPILVARFEREAVAGAHIEHPNVAAATDFGKLADGSYFLVLEYVEGQTVYDVVKRGALPFGRVAHIVRQIASALEAAHRMGVIHRDVKSRNIMLVEQQGDLAKLIDFGLAKIQLDRLSPVNPRRSRPESDPGRLTDVGEIFGTVAYLAPEAQLGMDAVDARSDLYALGIVMYEMLAGRRPFEAPDLGALFMKQRTAVPPKIAVRTPGIVVPPAIEAVMMRLLEKDPAARFQSGNDVVEALELACPDGGPTAADAPPLASSASEDSSSSSRTDAADGAASRIRRRLAHPLSIAVAAGAAILGAAGVVRLRVQSPPGATSLMVGSPMVGQARSRARLLGARTIAAVAVPEPFGGSAIPRLTPVDTDPATARTALLAAARRRDYAAAGRNLLALAAGEPSAFRDIEVASAARDTAAGLERVGGGDPIYEALADERLGNAGLDVLYSVVQDRGGGRAAERARELLQRPDIRRRASPELRIASELRDASCDGKIPLLQRAAREGDARTLIVLQTRGAACFPKNAALKAAVAELKARLGKH